MHQTALGVVDALRSADFRKGEHGVDHGVGGVQHQIALPFGHQRTAFGALRVGVQRQGFVPGPAAAEKGPESDLGPRSEHQRRVAADLGHQFVTALHALCRSCPDHRTRPGNLDVKRLLARILQDVFFAEGSLVDRREKDTRQRKRAFDRRPVALDGHRAVEHDPADLLLLKAILIDRKHPGNVPHETPHQRTVRIVRDGAQHRPHDTAFKHFFPYDIRRIRNPLISIWSRCESPSRTFHTMAVLSGTTSQRVCVPARAGAVRQQRNGRKKRLMRIMESGFSFLK